MDPQVLWPRDLQGDLEEPVRDPQSGPAVHLRERGEEHILLPVLFGHIEGDLSVIFDGISNIVLYWCIFGV